MSALDVLDETSLHGRGQVDGVLKDILEVAKEQRQRGAPKQQILCAVLFGFDNIVERHWKESRAAWTQCTKMLELLKEFDANAEQEGFLVTLGILVKEAKIEKVSAKMKHRTEHFAITEDAAKRVLPLKAAAAAAAAAAAKAKKTLTPSKKRSSDQISEQDFAFPNLFEPFKVLRDEMEARVAQLEAKAAKHDELEARVAQLEAKASDEAKASES